MPCWEMEKERKKDVDILFFLCVEISDQGVALVDQYDQLV